MTKYTIMQLQCILFNKWCLSRVYCSITNRKLFLPSSVKLSDVLIHKSKVAIQSSHGMKVITEDAAGNLNGKWHYREKNWYDTNLMEQSRGWFNLTLMHSLLGGQSQFLGESGEPRNQRQAKNLHPPGYHDILQWNLEKGKPIFTLVPRTFSLPRRVKPFELH